MKYFVSTLAIVALLAGSSLAGFNPDCKFFVTFDADPADYAAVEASDRVDPGVFEQFSFYLGICDYSSFNVLTVKLGIGTGVATPPTYTNLLPGGLTLGSWETGGVTMTASGPVTSAVHGPIYIIASGSAFCFGTVAGEITILDHDDYPRWVVGPDDVIDNYCVWQNVGVLMDPTPVEVSCFANVPVESQTWGGIKALYR